MEDSNDGKLNPSNVFSSKGSGVLSTEGEMPKEKEKVVIKKGFLASMLITISLGTF